MALATFFHPELQQDSESVLLSEQEAQHAKAARRLEVDDTVRILNGTGLIAQARIQQLRRNKFEVKILSCEHSPRSSHDTVIATAVPKPDRQRFMVESLVQLGVTHILPLDCQHSVPRFSNKIATKWPRYASEACKQSSNPWLPTILPACEIEYLAQLTLFNRIEHKWLADPACDQSARQVTNTNSNLICIGPEAGFTQQESQALKDLGCQAMKLAPFILRIETAAIAAAHRCLI